MASVAPTRLAPGEVAIHLVAGLGSGAGDAIFGGLNDLILVVGPDGAVEYANPAAGTLLGVEAAMLVGRSIRDLLHPDDVARAFDAESRVGTPAASIGVAAPLRMRHAQVGWRWLELSSGRFGHEGSRRTVVTGRVNDDQRSHERIVGLMAAGVPVEEVADALPGLADWRLPAVPFGIAIDGRGPARHLTGHPAAVELLRAVAGDEGWLGRVVVPGEPVTGVLADLGPAARQVGRRHGLTGWVATRVRSADGAAEALVLAGTHPGASPTSIVAERVRRVGGMAWLVVEWDGQRRALDRTARTDPLTGLPNRAATVEAIAAALARPDRRPLAVLALDLDGFSRVNDRLGHAAGDQVLAETARRLDAILDPGDVLGRVGNDELLGLRRGVSSRAGAEDLAHRAIAAMEPPFVVAGTQVRCGLSVGIAVTDGREHPRPDVDDLLARAGGALSVAQGAGGGRVVVTCGPGTLDRRDLL
ncbi:MAG TPA: GGDEF domain-containing protein [Iamia sp.]|nr:GGDEF domain-containing protein [Iamia sp.]